MEKLSIKEASERFEMSRARLYKLLNDGLIAGHLSQTKSKNEMSWVLANSLRTYLKNRDRKGGRPQIQCLHDDYVPAKIAAKKSGYALRHVYYLAKRGSIASKKGEGGVRVSYTNLLNYKNKNTIAK
ncbi:hypothetical protein PN36_27775 [Candidatus Thiomargarita nelsonii]|uniref:Helix-turn-helix domain-containing protein n=1 Tax=Candidatus Thiomargarita nelsonii TaxID=1003181 RepID=A0A4E0QLQ2_9GAMM|nr:hypothetical protein PN36_27775 [Candidatus Thiomargarita nelsonii]